METPISEAEAANQFPYISRALDAATEDERRLALVDAMLTYGHRFGYILSYLSTQAASKENPFQELSEQFSDLFLSWLGGETVTDRVDESERRAAAAVAVATQRPALGALAARAVLASREPDVELARQLLESYETTVSDTPLAERSLLVLARLIDLEEPDEAALAERVARGLELEPNVGEPVARRTFHVSAGGRYLELAIDARDDGDPDSQHRLAARGVELLDSFEPDDGILLALATLYTVIEDDQKAADTYRRIVESATADPSQQLTASLFEARMRFALGDFERVIELLDSRLAAFETRYLTAVADKDVESHGESFADAIINLAFSHASLGNWVAAITVLDRGKSRRLRYRAALRGVTGGAQILERERELYELKRGTSWRPPVVSNPAGDPLAAGVTTQTSLLEAYRRLRPELESDAFASSLLTELACVLAPDEAALILGQRSEGALVVAVRPGDTESPALASLVPLSAERWVNVLAPDEGYGLLTAWSAGRAEYAVALERVLKLADELVGATATELGKCGVRRLIVLPHRFLHLIPFWAVPSLAVFEVETAPSAAALVKARTEPAPPLGSSAVVVVNPTGDLRLAAAEGDAVVRRLAAAGVSAHRLTRSEATETAVLEALMQRPGLLHFCGHGHSNLLRPEQSGLLMSPTRELLAGGGDPFVAWMAAVPQWDEKGDMRSGDVPGIGRVIEERDENTVQRWLEYGDRGTFWTRYEAGRRVAAAELWSAGDMLVGGELDSCALVVLSACETGLGRLGETKLDESAGLPAALQLAGAASVIATLWPVGDAQSALFVDELYTELARCRGLVNLAEVVHTVRTRFRRMSRDTALAHVGELRAHTSNPIARFALERFIQDLTAGAEHPFADPYDWAPFFVSGRSRIRNEELV